MNASQQTETQARLEKLEQSLHATKAIVALLVAALAALIAVALIPALGVAALILAIFLGALLFIAAIRVALEKLSPPPTLPENGDTGMAKRP